MPPLPIAAAVRPVVLALAPPAPGLEGGTQSPCLAPLGGSRLLERLLGTLASQGLRTPLLVTGRSSGPALRAVLGARVPVHEVADGDRRAALETALARTEEDLLLVHDAERALTPAATVGAVLEAMAEDAGASVDAVVPVIAMTDSVKQVLPAGLRNIDRSTLAGLQSPRLLRRAALTEAIAAPAAPADAADRALGAPRLDLHRYDEITAALAQGAQVRTVHGSHSGFAVEDRLSFWQAQISLGLARDTSHRHGLARRG